MRKDPKTDRAAKILSRLDRIPVWAFPASFLAIIGLGYFFTFFDITNIGLAMPAIAAQFGLTGSESLFIALAVGLIGYIIGSYLIGSIADRRGRIKMMALTMALTAIGSFGDALAGGVFTLALWRFITGMGVGASLNLVSTYLGELSPPGRRGRIAVLTFLIGIMGQAVTPFVAFALVPNFLIGWRILFAIGGSVAAIAGCLMLILPESPRWLALHGRLDEAENIVGSMEKFTAGKGIRLPRPQKTEMDASRGRFPTAYLFHRKYAKRLALFASMWFFWYFGNYAFLGDAATIISSHGITIANSILFFAVGAVGYPVGAVVMLSIVDRFERKHMIFVSSAIWLCGMLLIASLANDYVIMFGTFLASFALGLYLQIAYTYTAESYPTRARSSGFALSDGLGHLGGAIGALALPIMVSTLGFGAGFAAIGITGLVAGTIALSGPRSSGLALEKVSG
jgi:MFS family permease